MLCRGAARYKRGVRVFITGVGVVSSIGLGKDAFFRGLAEGKSGISPVEAFDAVRIGRSNAGEVKGFVAKDHLRPAEIRRMGRCSQMALAAARMAIADAAIDPALLRGPRVAVVLGTTMGEADVLEDLDHAWIKKGACVIPYGTMSAVELSLTDIMDKIVMDDWGQARSGPFGALRAHVDSGRLSEKNLHAELGQIVAGLKPGRESDDETTLFWHRGLSLSDIALGAAMLDKARAMNVGQSLRFR